MPSMLARTCSPFAVMRSTATSLSQVRPYMREIGPQPPPCASPPMCTSLQPPPENRQPFFHNVV